MKMHTDPNRMVECYDFWEDNNITYKYEGDYSTHVYTERAQQIIEEHAENKVNISLETYDIMYRESKMKSVSSMSLKHPSCD